MSRKRNQAKRKSDRNPNPGAKPFGTKAWVARALERKFRRAAVLPGEDTEERTEERIAALSEYLTYRKLHRILWPRTETHGAAVWEDPGWMNG